MIRKTSVEQVTYLNKKKKKIKIEEPVSLVKSYFHRFPHLRFRSPGSLHLRCGLQKERKRNKNDKLIIDVLNVEYFSELFTFGDDY